MANPQPRAHPEPDVIARSTEERAITRVVVLAVLLTIGAIALLMLSGGNTEALLPGPWWSAIAIGLLFALAERFTFHIEYRREAQSFSLSEVPTVLALAFVGPVVAIIARLIGSLIAVTANGQRRAPYKSFLNSGLFCFEVSLAFAIVRQVVNRDDFNGGRFLVAAAFSTGLATVLGSLVVAVAISFFEGGARRRLLETAKTVGVSGPFSGTVAAVAAAPALFGFEIAFLSIVPVVGVWMLLLRLGRLDQNHRDLESMHGFAGIVGQSLDPDVVASSGLHEALRLIRASSGLISVYDDAGLVIAEAAVGAFLPPAPVARCDPRWAASLDGSGAAFLAADFDWGDDIYAVPTGNTVVAPIRDDRGVIGILVMTDRQGVNENFDEHDLTRTTTLVAHLATSMRKTLLHTSMEYAALHDPLTGHLNRAAFDEAVTTSLAELHTSSCSAVLMLDLDKFKDVNDTLGHHVGDAVLIEFARRVDGLLEPTDALARFGGDEFAVFITRSSMAEMRELAHRIVSESYAPITLDDLGIVVTVSVGIAVAHDDDRDATALLRRADVAMYAAKRQHGGFEVYCEDIDRRTPERLSLLGDLREALDTGAITAHYQPKIDLATSTIIGFEALARWHHPVRGWVPPDEFIPVAEETGLIKQLTDHVLTTALGATRTWQDAGLDLCVAVNLSTLDLLDELLADRIAHRIEQHGLLPDRLTLEITESSLMTDTPRTMATVAQLNRLGVRLSLDDFGTGYSSLSYLRQLPVSELKIDRSFLADILVEPQDEMIVRSTIDLGHNLGLHVVAEGIENREVQDRLISLGCDVGQGYGISRPLPPDQLNTWLANTDLRIVKIRPPEPSASLMTESAPPG